MGSRGDTKPTDMIKTLSNDNPEDVTAGLFTQNMFSVIVSALNGGTVVVQTQGIDSDDPTSGTVTDWVTVHTFTEAGQYVVMRGENDRVRLTLSGNTGTTVASVSGVAGRD